MNSSEELKNGSMSSESSETPKEKELSVETQDTISNSLIEQKTFLESKTAQVLMEKYNTADKDISSEKKEEITRLKNEGKNEVEILNATNGWRVAFGEKGGEEIRKRVQVLEKASQIKNIDELNPIAKSLILGELNEQAKYLKRLHEGTKNPTEKEQLKNKIDSLTAARKELLGAITEQTPEELNKEINREAEEEKTKLKNETIEAKEKMRGYNAQKDKLLEELEKLDQFKDSVLIEEKKVELAMTRGELKKLGDEVKEKENIFLNQDILKEKLLEEKLMNNAILEGNDVKTAQDEILKNKEGESTLTSDQKIEPGEQGKQDEINKNTASVLSSENKSFFGKMSEGGKKIATQVYEGLYKIPGVNRIVGKMEISYNQFWIDRHQGKAVKFKEKMGDLNLRIGMLDQSKGEIESVIKDLKKQNIPGAESLQLKLYDINRQKADLLNDKDRIQSKFEARDNKIKLYTNERDRVADKLIECYEEKLKPMEAELERLQTFRDHVDLLAAVTEAKHNEQLAKLGDIEKTKNQTEDALRKTGMSEKAIRRFEAIKLLEGALAKGREKVRAEKESLTQRKAEINKKIAKVDAKANSYRDKREKFARVKERRPIKIDTATRQKGEVFTGKEVTESHPRAKTDHTEEPISAEVERKGNVEEESVKNKERLSTMAYINGWNAFLKDTYKGDAKLIDANDFMGVTYLSENYKLDFKDFKNILSKYLKYKKLPMEQFNKKIDTFFEEKIKVKK